MLFIVFCYCAIWNIYYLFIHLEKVYMKYYFYNIQGVFLPPACIRILVDQHLEIFLFACQIIVMIISLSFKFPFPSKEFTSFSFTFCSHRFLLLRYLFSSGMPYFSIGFYYFFADIWWFFIAFVLYHFYILQISSLSLTSLTFFLLF